MELSSEQADNLFNDLKRDLDVIVHFVRCSRLAGIRSINFVEPMPSLDHLERLLNRVASNLSVSGLRISFDIDFHLSLFSHEQQKELLDTASFIYGGCVSFPLERASSLDATHVYNIISSGN